MSKNRRIKSVKTELVKKAREAMLAAVQLYNNPQVTFKAESFITLAVIGWTYLLHAYYRNNGIDYRYYRYVGKKKVYDKTKYGAYKHWELERCLNDTDCPLDNDTITNLRFLIGYVLVGTGFQVLFHSPPGVLFTFPSQYYTLSVTG